MKTQPQHTQGELEQLGGVSAQKRILDEKHWIDIIIDGKGIVSSIYGNTREETEANAQRIVKAVNMHDALVERLKKSTEEIIYLLEEVKKYQNGSYRASTTIVRNQELLKQAEQK